MFCPCAAALEASSYAGEVGLGRWVGKRGSLSLTRVPALGEFKDSSFPLAGGFCWANDGIERVRCSSEDDVQE